MIKLLKIFFTIACCFLFSNFATAQTQYLITGNIQGEIKPCGCSEEGDLGGVERASTFFQQIKKKKKSLVWFDLGNFAQEPTAQGKLKNQILQQYFLKNKVSAILPSPREFAQGSKIFKRLPLPYVLTNLKKKLPSTKAKRIVSGIEIFGYLSPQYLSKGLHQSTYLSSTVKFLKTVKQLSQKQKKFLLFRGSKEELAIIQKSKQFQFIFVANEATQEEKQKLSFVQKGQKYFVPPVKNQGVLVFQANAQKIPLNQTAKVLWLSSKFPDAKYWKPIFKKYNASVKNLFFQQFILKKNARKKSIYKGASTCVNCHQKEAKVWKASRHAGAWKTLKKIGKNFDPECVVCHTVGFQNRGFVSEKITPHLTSVQCENCHGSMKDNHIDPKKRTVRKKVTEATCKTCHMGSHSPSFSFKKYWQKIKHNKVK
ncbi:MAG: hypothetical protein ACI86H_001400 [bacterium]|jgi:hypothetical protein